MRKRPAKMQVRGISVSALEDEWQRRATAVAIEQARGVINSGVVPPMTPVGRLSDVEWGWIAASVIFGWISTRAEQATSNGAGVNKYIREADLDPNPWLAGAVSACLPELAHIKIDWTKPLGELAREDVINFLTDAYILISKAIEARDRGEKEVTRKAPDGTAPPEAQMDWDDGIPERYA